MASMTSVRYAAAVWLVMAASHALAQDAARNAAQAYPARPIRLIVAFSPGSPTDLVARVVGQNLTDSWGRNVVVENRPGAGGIIASQSAKRASPDGYTIDESGFPGFSGHTWFSFLAPAGTPPAIVNKLNAEINRILQLPDSKARLAALSLEFTPNSAAEFAADLKAEVAKYAKMVKETGARVE